MLIPILPRIYSFLAALRDGGAFNNSLSLNQTLVDFSSQMNLFHTNIECPTEDGVTTPNASASLDVDANVHASISIGAVAAGTIIPPQITEFGLDFGATYCARLGLEI